MLIHSAIWFVVGFALAICALRMIDRSYSGINGALAWILLFAGFCLMAWGVILGAVH